MSMAGESFNHLLFAGPPGASVEKRGRSASVPVHPCSTWPSDDLCISDQAQALVLHGKRNWMRLGIFFFSTCGPVQRSGFALNAPRNTPHGSRAQVTCGGAEVLSDCCSFR